MYYSCLTRRCRVADKSVVLMNGFAIIFLGFVSFGVLHTKVWTFPLDLYILTNNPSDPQIHAMAMVRINRFLSIFFPLTSLPVRLMVITGIMTLIISVLFWYICPSHFCMAVLIPGFFSGFFSQTHLQPHISWLQKSVCKPFNGLKLTKRAWKISIGNENSKLHHRRRTWR